MPLIEDELGITYTASRPESVTAFNQVIEAYLASRDNVMPMLEKLIDDDPDMPLARCFRGYLLKLAADPRFSTPLKQIVRSLNGIKSKLPERESQHVLALTRWAENDTDATLRVLEGVLNDDPRDMLALRIAHYLHFYSGASGDIRDSVARSLSKWDKGAPFYSYLLGMHSFGLEESGEYEAAEVAGKQAVALNSDDIWAAHAVAHVFQMQSRFDEGVPWINSLMGTWTNANNFIYHMHWHQALCHIGLGELDQALGIYDKHLTQVLEDDFYLDICNAASLLWRLEILGLDVGDRWQALLALSRARVTDDELIFSSLHYLMTPARLGDKEAVDRALAHYDTWAKSGSGQGHVAKTVGLPLAQAIADIGAGNKEKAFATLNEIKDKVFLIGGSHAQRDLFNQLREFAKG